MLLLLCCKMKIHDRYCIKTAVNQALSTKRNSLLVFQYNSSFKNSIATTMILRAWLKLWLLNVKNLRHSRAFNSSLISSTCLLWNPLKMYTVFKGTTVSCLPGTLGSKEIQKSFNALLVWLSARHNRGYKICREISL